MKDLQILSTFSSYFIVIFYEHIRTKILRIRKYYEIVVLYFVNLKDFKIIFKWIKRI